jgi:hypothetical protein
VQPSAYVGASDAAARFIADPAVGAAWDAPSALPEMSVGALAAHLGRQVVLTADVLAADPPEQSPISLLEHYQRSAWANSPLDDPANVGIRNRSDTGAAAGQGAVAKQVRAAADALGPALDGVSLDRVVVLPWTGWALTLEDYLSTRTLEIVIHLDDLAVSVGATPPALPEEASDGTLVLLTRLAAHRHGSAALIRALSRAERAPASIAAFLQDRLLTGPAGRRSG